MPTSAIQACELPDDAFLRRYLQEGGYADCFAIELPIAASQAEYVEAFYTTSVFKLERWLLAKLVARPSTDAQAGDLAAGKRDAFAAWTVEDRRDDQLLLRDLAGRTRSWLMSMPAADRSATRLYFGSAVVPVVDRRGVARLGWMFRALLGFHRLYSRILLRAAVSRLMRGRRAAS
ncbi:MAG TPA: hypothetical protein VEA16_03315 [Vicinamibacterales bacterium]|nr:hypothetical protein [Vicinamibacterales bacterium]